VFEHLSNLVLSFECLLPICVFLKARNEFVFEMAARCLNFVKRLKIIEVYVLLIELFKYLRASCNGFIQFFPRRVHSFRPNKTNFAIRNLGLSIWQSELTI